MSHRPHALYLAVYVGVELGGESVNLAIYLARDSEEAASLLAFRLDVGARVVKAHLLTSVAARKMLSRYFSARYVCSLLRDRDCLHDWSFRAALCG